MGRNSPNWFFLSSFIFLRMKLRILKFWKEYFTLPHPSHFITDLWIPWKVFEIIEVFFNFNSLRNFCLVNSSSLASISCCIKSIWLKLFKEISGGFNSWCNLSIIKNIKSFASAAWFPLNKGFNTSKTSLKLFGIIYDWKVVLNSYNKLV